MATRHQELQAQRGCEHAGSAGTPGERIPPAVTWRWKGCGSSSHSRASWWHSRTISAGPLGTATSMARASGSQVWVKMGPGEHREGQPVPTLTSTPLPSSLTLQLDGNHVAAADSQASVGDGTQGDQDPPPAFRWEAVKLNLPLRGAGGERGPTAHPHPRRVPRTHRHVARCPVPPPHLQPAGPVGAQLQEVELQPADSCGTPAIADTGGTVPRPGFTFPGFPQRDKAGPSQTTARTCGRDGQAHPQAGLAGQRGLAQPRRAQRQGGRGQRGPRGGSPAAAGPGQRAVGCRERRGEEPRTGPRLAPGESSRGGSPRTGIAQRRGSPRTGILLQRGTPRTGNRPAPPRSEPGSDLGPTGEPPPGPAPPPPRTPGAQPGGPTHRWPGTPASKETGISAAPAATPAPRSFFPVPLSPTLTKLAETRGRGTAGRTGGGGGSNAAAAAAAARRATARTGQPMAESPAAELRSHRRCRLPAPGRPRRIPPAARAAPPATRLRRRRHEWESTGGALFPYGDTRSKPQHRARPRGRPHPQQPPCSTASGPRTLHAWRAEPPPNPPHFFFFSCVLVNQESSSFLL